MIVAGDCVSDGEDEKMTDVDDNDDDDNYDSNNDASSSSFFIIVIYLTASRLSPSSKTSPQVNRPANRVGKKTRLSFANLAVVNF